jgi:hypothetical protein
MERINNNPVWHYLGVGLMAVVGIGAAGVRQRVRLPDHRDGRRAARRPAAGQPEAADVGDAAMGVRLLLRGGDLAPVA